MNCVPVEKPRSLIIELSKNIYMQKLNRTLLAFSGSSLSPLYILSVSAGMGHAVFFFYDVCRPVFLFDLFLDSILCRLHAFKSALRRIHEKSCQMGRRPLFVGVDHFNPAFVYCFILTIRRV